MNIVFTIKRKDFKNLEMDLFSKEFSQQTNITINFFDSEEIYSYKTVLYENRLLLATDVGA